MGGGILLGTGLLLMSIHFRSENLKWEKSRIIIRILVFVVDICVIIWGSVVGFGKLYLSNVTINKLYTITVFDILK